MKKYAKPTISTPLLHISIVPCSSLEVSCHGIPEQISASQIVLGDWGTGGLGDGLWHCFPCFTNIKVLE